MIITDYGSFDGNSWEDFCHKCLKIKYKDNEYTKIPAKNQGDLGIEGYTNDGIVFQCYYPEQEYNLYDHQRTKITKDLRKLEKNGEVLLNKYLLGIQIKKWYLVTPIYDDKKLIEHCVSKTKEYRNKNLKYLSDDFKVLLADTDFFTEEALIVLNRINQKIDFEPEKTSSNNINWNECQSDLVKNLIRKISATFDNQNEDASRRKIDRLVQIYMDYYLKGFKIINKLESTYINQYEQLIRLKDNYETEVEVKCLTSIKQNNLLLSEITMDFEKKLTDEFGSIFSTTMINTLKSQIIAAWLLHCPMNFGD